MDQAISDENQAEIGKMARVHAARMALAMYTNEPCRICGRMIEADDLRDLVFAGYSKRWPARAAHKRCWEGFLDTCVALGEAGKGADNGLRNSIHSG